MALAHRRGVIKAIAPATRTGMMLMLVCYLAPILFTKAGFALYRQTVALFDLDFFRALAVPLWLIPLRTGGGFRLP
jgi:hypothetical protein